ncbi:unnamed protein product [Lactuca saligna]|uniref:Uncharacterized protein n=1 Tax=Lactuca saligna TaxID=75948 RepID=A0AA35ZY90_LACSI|nr:unnamed protein product [Lactuca saligna]
MFRAFVKNRIGSYVNSNHIVTMEGGEICKPKYEVFGLEMNGRKDLLSIDVAEGRGRNIKLSVTNLHKMDDYNHEYNNKGRELSIISDDLTNLSSTVEEKAKWIFNKKIKEWLHQILQKLLMDPLELNFIGIKNMISC